MIYLLYETFSHDHSDEAGRTQMETAQVLLGRDEGKDLPLTCFQVVAARPGASQIRSHTRTQTRSQTSSQIRSQVRSKIKFAQGKEASQESESRRESHDVDYVIPH